MTGFDYNRLAFVYCYNFKSEFSPESTVIIDWSFGLSGFFFMAKCSKELSELGTICG